MACRGEIRMSNSAQDMDFQDWMEMLWEGPLEQSWSLVESDIDGVLVMHWVHLGLQWDLINQVQRGFVFYFWESLSSRNALETL